MSRRRRIALVGLGAVAATAGGILLLRKPLTRLAFSTAIDNNGYDRASVSFVDTDICTVTAESIEGPSSPTRSTPCCARRRPSIAIVRRRW